MKYIVVGLGNFGSTLALKLAEGGHEVIGVDNNESHINLLKAGLDDYAEAEFHSAPHHVDSSPDRGKCFHVGRSSS